MWQRCFIVFAIKKKLSAKNNRALPEQARTQAEQAL